MIEKKITPAASFVPVLKFTRILTRQDVVNKVTSKESTLSNNVEPLKK